MGPALQTASVIQINENENAQARTILSKLIGENKSLPYIDVINYAAATFCGDICLVREAPDGRVHVLIGDFTGHGLGPAIATVPAASSFNAMTAKGMSSSEILYEMNSKLSSLLPTGVFLAAAMLEFDPFTRVLGLWNCGLPDIFIIGEHGDILQRFPSHGLPLGIQTDLDCSPVYFDFDYGSYLLAYTDGLVEIFPDDMPGFGPQELEQTIKDGPLNTLVERLKNRVMKFDSSQIIDDITAVILDIQGFYDQSLRQVESKNQIESINLSPDSYDQIHLENSLKVCPCAIRRLAPVTLIMNILHDIELTSKSSQNVFIILSELINNAVDHGLLRLDSNIKSQDGGFAAYLQQRQQRLENACDGEIKIDIKVKCNSEGDRCLEVHVEDTGPGFDYTDINRYAEFSTKTHGRGIALVKSLCKLEYFGRGNRVRAEYFLDKP